MRIASVRIEGLMLSLVGIALSLVVFGSYYPYLMNPRYRWLSAATALALAALGAIRLLWPPGKPRLSRALLFLLLLGLFAAAYGRISVQRAAIRPQENRGWETLQELQALPAGYVPINAVELFLLAEENLAEKVDRPYVILGQVRHTTELNALGEFAIARVFVYCCSADATAVGFRVPYAGKLSLRDGQWIRLAGRLEAMPVPSDLSDLIRMPGVFYTALHPIYRLRATKIDLVDEPSPPFIFQISDVEPYYY
jgi:hypothetical protein